MWHVCLGTANTPSPYFSKKFDASPHHGWTGLINCTSELIDEMQTKCNIQGDWENQNQIFLTSRIWMTPVLLWLLCTLTIALMAGQDVGRDFSKWLVQVWGYQVTQARLFASLNDTLRGTQSPQMSSGLTKYAFAKWTYIE